MNIAIYNNYVTIIQIKWNFVQYQENVTYPWYTRLFVFARETTRLRVERVTSVPTKLEKIRKILEILDFPRGKFSKGRENSRRFDRRQKGLAEAWKYQ